MALTYEPIYTTTLGTAATPITITSIPQGYTDIIVSMVFRDSVTSENNVNFRVNGISSSAYAYSKMRNSGGSINNEFVSSSNLVNLGPTPGTSGVNRWGALELEINDYSTNGILSKNFVWTLGSIGNNAGSSQVILGSGLYTNDIPITSIEFREALFQAGTTITIWGVLKA